MNTNITGLPQYQCHKRVRAAKIESIHRLSKSRTGSVVLEFAEPGVSPLRVSADYVKKHQPKAGGYYVVYEDGYESFSPAVAFETGYTLIN